MKEMKKYIAMMLVILLTLSLNINAQKKTQSQDAADAPAFEQYDPLTPQMFAFDKKHGIFAGINNVDNAIDILNYEGDTIYRKSRILVDVFERRHDVHHIYRAQSVAIYENNIVYLASHRDSCYLAVLDLDGKLIKKLVFSGKASAFSYTPSDQELYIAGENAEGYDVFAISTKDGFENISLEKAPFEHYKRPKKAEVILEKDPVGLGMAAIAMSVVFLGLLLLYLVFKQLGLALSGSKKTQKNSSVVIPQAGAPAKKVSVAGEITGEELAAIAAAIFEYDNQYHDEENTVLTINKVSRNYSPWSSKLYGLNTYWK